MSLRDKMLAVMADVNSAVAEREELVELIAIALLTRKNLFILGDPGQAKSYAINAFRSRITGAKQFERLLSKQTDEEQLFGRLDLSSLIPGSVPESAFEGDSIYQNLRFDLQSFLNGLPKMKSETATFDKLAEVSGKLDAYRKAVAALHPCEPVVQTAGKIPEADIVFLDEIFKCNDGVLNALLTALNERKYTNEGRTYPIPTISFFAASNEIPNFNDPEEKILAALYDRLELKVVTENISEKAHRLAILKDKLGGSFGAVHATISLEELRAMQQEVSSIKVSDKIHDLMDDVLCALRAQIPRVRPKIPQLFFHCTGKGVAGGTYGGHIDGSSGAAELLLAAAERPRVCNRHVGASVHQSDAGKGQRSSCYGTGRKGRFRQRLRCGGKRAHEAGCAPQIPR